MEEAAETTGMRLDELGKKVLKWKVRSPSPDEIDAVYLENMNVSDIIKVVLSQQSSIKVDIKNLQFYLELEIEKVSRLEKALEQVIEQKQILRCEVKSLKEELQGMKSLKTELRSEVKSLKEELQGMKSLVTESKRQASLLKLFDLCSMYNYYVTIPLLSQLGYAGWTDFVEKFKDTRADVKDGLVSEAVFDQMKLSINASLGGIDIESVVNCVPDGFAVEVADLRSIKDQEHFLSQCQQYPFSPEMSSFADALIRQLLEVPLKRMKRAIV